MPKVFPNELGPVVILSLSVSRTCYLLLINMIWQKWWDATCSMTIPSQEIEEKQSSLVDCEEASCHVVTRPCGKEVQGSSWSWNLPSPTAPQPREDGNYPCGHCQYTLRTRWHGLWKAGYITISKKEAYQYQWCHLLQWPTSRSHDQSKYSELWASWVHSYGLVRTYNHFHLCTNISILGTD